MAIQDQRVYAVAEWQQQGQWYSVVRVTVSNYGQEPVVDPEISFRVDADQTTTNNYGLVWTRDGDLITGRFVPEKRTVPAGGSQSFTLGISRSAPGSGPLPRDFKVDGADAVPPEDKEPPSVPTNLRAEVVGATQATVAWDPSSDNVAVAGYDVHRSGDVPVVRVTGPSVQLRMLTPSTDYRVQVEAVDLAGNRSGLSQQLDLTTTDRIPDAGPWDVPRAPYVDYMAWPNPQISQYAEQSGMDGFMLGFLVASPSRKLAWGGIAGEEWQADKSSHGKTDIAAFRAAGGKVVFSFGGASGEPIEAVEESVQKIIAEYEGVIANYQLTHLDFDFEGAFVSNREAHLRHTAAIAHILTSHPRLKVSYTLPADAQLTEGSAGFSPHGLQLLQTIAEAGIEPGLINGMLMEFGQGAPPDAGECTIIGLKAMHAQVSTLWPNWSSEKVWQRLGACPMFGYHINGRCFTLEDMRELVEFAHEHKLGALTGWDATRDHNQNNPDVVPRCEIGSGCKDLYRCTCVDQHPFDFCKIISLYKNGAGTRSGGSGGGSVGGSLGGR
ncbi:fibronectin type III domain-containing protein [Streptomyces sp. MST-110588]|uniref:fibronectin type III domain-containing protein n=1 Tax=Streptomyces sp. MST-110588 TaxID=2833628 RepID=UPI001F5DC631|nr:fibronectin type III domain-containing protein [Streptomyces sp. MST-110588]UNO41237.1 fibronectin type III domain-containing protein [Streptomyces sp. MST-110588]